MSEFAGEMYLATESSNISSYGYDNGSRILRIIYRGNTLSARGPVYDYLKVPGLKWDELKAAKSKGTFVSAKIQSAYEFVKIEDGAPARKSGTVEKTLIALKKEMTRSPGVHLFFCLWNMTGKPDTSQETEKARLFKNCKAMIVLAAGSNSLSAAILPEAIRLAAEQNI